MQKSSLIVHRSLVLALALTSVALAAPQQESPKQNPRTTQAKPIKPAAEPQATAPDSDSLKLKSIEEHRVLDVVKPDENDWSARMRQDKEGLFLTFTANLPAGNHVLSIIQPKSLTATDSTGKSLVEPVDEFHDETEYFQLASSFMGEDDAPTEITLHLGLPARAAASISCTADFEAVIYTGTEDRDLPLSSKVVALNDLLPGKKVQMRYTNNDNNPVIEIRPAEAKDVIRELSVIQGDSTIETNGWYSDGKTVTYPLAQPITGDMTVRMKVVTGMATVPMHLNLRNQQLP